MEFSRIVLDNEATMFLVVAELYERYDGEPSTRRVPVYLTNDSGDAWIFIDQGAGPAIEHFPGHDPDKACYGMLEFNRRWFPIPDDNLAALDAL
jgi:hypothetical protein